MNDPELESTMDVTWRNFLAALRTGKTEAAKDSWRELDRLRATRTPEQQARALRAAGLQANGTCGHYDGLDKGVCLRCRAIVGGAR